MKTKKLGNSIAKISVAPDAIGSMEKKLQEDLAMLREHMVKVEKSAQESGQRIKRWRSAIATAKQERENAEGSLSKNAIEMTNQFLKDAEQRLSSLESHALTHDSDEWVNLVQAKDAMESLQSRLELQRFRENFTMQTEPAFHQPGNVKTIDNDDLAGIERELRKWSHSIEALKELRS